MKWIQYKLSTTPDAVEAISYQLYEMGIQGIEVEDGIPLSDEDKKKMYIDMVEPPKIKDKNLAYIKFYLSEEEDHTAFIEKIEEILKKISLELPIGKGTVETLVTDETDWADNWKKYFKPFRVGEHMIIKPSWETLEAVDENDIIIEIDPGMAFGTGTHETTSLCIQLLQKYLKKGHKVIDVGCGSGILGITSAKLGIEQVLCSDIDPNAVKVAKENVRLNGVEGQVQVVQGDLIETVSEKADLIVANILADVIIYLTQDIKKVLVEGGLFITSGIILERVDDVVKALEAQGLNILEIQKKGEWAAIVAS